MPVPVTLAEVVPKEPEKGRLLHTLTNWGYSSQSGVDFPVWSGGAHCSRRPAFRPRFRPRLRHFPDVTFEPKGKLKLTYSFMMSVTCYTRFFGEANKTTKIN